MKCRSAVAAVTLLMAVSACDRPAPASPTPAPSTEASPPATVAGADTRPAAPPVASVAPSAAPTFAQVFPGATVEGEPLSAGGAAGPGGLVTFTTEAEPEAVVSFYRDKAEAAGLASVMTMNRGDSQAYGAANPANGATVQVVATAVEDAPTSVQLTWSAGQ